MLFLQHLQVGPSALSHLVINSDNRINSENLWDSLNEISALRKACFDKGRHKHQKLN